MTPRCAKLVFDDHLHITRQDHLGKQLWQTIGMAAGIVLLLMVHTWYGAKRRGAHPHHFNAAYNQVGKKNL